MDLDTFRWLLTEPGQEALNFATLGTAEGTAAIKLGEQLRRRASAAQAAAAMAQAALRLSGEAKFGPDASRMYFTSEGLEQATRIEVARHRANRLVAHNPRSVIDLGCGIGGDLVAMASAGLVATGVDLDPLRVGLATANLAAFSLPGTVTFADATSTDLDPHSVVFADPARRTARGRTFDVGAYSPPWSFVTALLERRSVVKVAPGIAHHLVPDGVEAEWVSYRGEVKEAALWSHDLATARRRATVIGPGGSTTITEADDPGEAPSRPFGRYLYEPDGAVIRAGLVTAVACGVDGWLLDKRIAYVSADSLVDLPYARAYEVIEELPFKTKKLKAALAERQIGKLTIKKRGVDMTPETLRKRLKLSGDNEATLVMTRVGDSGLSLLTRPLY